MMLIVPFDCPCGVLSDTKKTYEECCQPLHQADICADSAEQLMRSRYSAFALVLPDYIVKTTLPAQQPLLDKQAIQAWAADTDWAGLEVIKYNDKVTKRHAQVEFKAYYESVDGRKAHHELSIFVQVKDTKERTRWYFLDPTVQMRVTQKQPCICGSGIKFKRCCGQFLIT